MKYIVKLFLIISSLQFMPTLAMEEKTNQNQVERVDLIGCFSNELWEYILARHASLECSDLDANILKCDDIYQAIANLREKLPVLFKKIRHVCKLFNGLQNATFRNSIKIHYRKLLIDKYLQQRDNGLYPIGATWGSELDINDEIGIFLAGNGKDNAILAKIIESNLFVSELEIYENIISVLLFYGANPNSADDKGELALHKILRSSQVGLMMNIIKMLLDYGTNVQQVNVNGETAISIAANNPRIDANLQAILQKSIVNAKTTENDSAQIGWCNLI